MYIYLTDIGMTFIRIITYLQHTFLKDYLDASGSYIRYMCTLNQAKSVPGSNIASNHTYMEPQPFPLWVKVDMHGYRDREW